jgi:NosR/NirI family nitrous oxide reductase transcriptional regulator
MIFPGSEKIGEIGGVPPSAAVYKSGRQVGYLFSTWDVTQSKGFSDRPLILLVGLDLGGRITGARLVHHSEPMAMLGVPDEEFQRFAENYKGLDVRTGVDVVVKLSSSASLALGQENFSARGAPGTTDAARIDAISRATTSSLLMSDAIVRGARIIARSRGILPPVRTRAARLDVDRFAPANWPELEATGAIAHLRILYGDVTEKLGQAGADGRPAAAPDALLVDFYVALLTPAGIGVNILGKTWYDQYTTGRSADDQIMLLAANGAHSFLGDGWEHGDVLDWVEIVQGETTIRLPTRQIKTLPFVHAEKPPDLTERALVFFPGGGEFDPTRPFQVNLLVTGATTVGRRGGGGPQAGRGEGKSSRRHASGGQDGRQLEGYLARPPGQNHGPNAGVVYAHCDPVPTELRHAPSAAASLDPDRVSELDPGLVGLVRRGPADGGQCDRGYPFLVHGLPMGLRSG